MRCGGNLVIPSGSCPGESRVQIRASQLGKSFGQGGGLLVIATLNVGSNPTFPTFNKNKNKEENEQMEKS